jgi:hypothetical protein
MARTLQDLLDLEEIRDLRNRYAHYFDANEIEKLGSLFTLDAVCEFGEPYGGDWAGREEIARRYGEVHAARPEPFAFMHATTTPIVDLIDATTATGRAYLLDLNLGPEATQPLMLVGVYDDLYRKVDGQWLIHRTRIDFIWPRRDYAGPRKL